MPAQFPMFRIERDCNYAQQCRLMRAWVEWGVPKAQARDWWFAMGFDAQHFNKVLWEAENWIRREVLYMQLEHAQRNYNPPPPYVTLSMAAGSSSAGMVWVSFHDGSVIHVEEEGSES